MTMVEWLALVSAGFTVWVWLPPDAVLRLTQPLKLRLPKWAEPVPQAMDSKKRWCVAAIIGLFVVGYGWDMTPWVIAVGPLIATAVWIGLGRLEPQGARRRRLETIYALPQALDLVQACVGSGQPLRHAIATVGEAMGPPVSDLFDAVTNAISVGMSDEQAWQVLENNPIVGSLARDLARSTAWGMAITDVLAQHSNDLRRLGKNQRLASAKTVGVKSVLPLGVCYLPAFILIGVVPVIAGGLSQFF